VSKVLDCILYFTQFEREEPKISDTLVLTPDYTPMTFLPLSTISWQTSVRLMYLDRVTPIHYYEDWFVKGASASYQIPAVVVTREWFKGRKQGMRFSRGNLYIRDLYTCQFCGESFTAKDLTIDHVNPRSKGGKTSWTNCATACKDCNAKKGNQYWRPIREPQAPDYWSLVNARRKVAFKAPHDSWYQYILPKEKKLSYSVK
jgi:5-methylcytosine-specific restriction endonuclease McrA